MRSAGKQRMRSYVHDSKSGAQLAGKATLELVEAIHDRLSIWAYKNLDGDWYPCRNMRQLETLRDCGMDVREVFIFNKR
jgi:hypothetical protein